MDDNLHKFVTIIEKYMVTSSCPSMELAGFLKGYINGLWNAGAITTSEWRQLNESYVLPIASKAQKEWDDVPNLNDL